MKGDFVNEVSLFSELFTWSDTNYRIVSGYDEVGNYSSVPLFHVEHRWLSWCVQINMTNHYFRGSRRTVTDQNFRWQYETIRSHTFIIALGYIAKLLMTSIGLISHKNGIWWIFSQCKFASSLCKSSFTRMKFRLMRCPSMSYKLSILFEEKEEQRKMGCKVHQTLKVHDFLMQL